jgi:hypothetical protein
VFLTLLPNFVCTLVAGMLKNWFKSESGRVVDPDPDWIRIQ